MNKKQTVEDILARIKILKERRKEAQDNTHLGMVNSEIRTLYRVLENKSYHNTW